MIRNPKNLLLAIVAPTILCAFACNREIPLRLTVTQDSAVVNVETLGEYETTIARVRLSDQHAHKVVWEVERYSGTPQIHSFKLQEGFNPAKLLLPEHGEYRVVMPAADSFELRRGTKYLLELWSRDSIAPQVGREFVFTGR